MHLRSTRCLVVLAALVAGTALSAHELFFRLDRYFVAAHVTVSVPIYSGTFTTNENAVARERLTDLSLTTAAGRQDIDRARWSEQEPMSVLTLESGEPGSHVLGASLRPRVLELEGAKFNAYLEEEGLDSILAARKTQGRLGEGSRERYSKYLKAVLQVGEVVTAEVVTRPLGQAAEIVALDNTTTLKVGDTLRIRCLVDGQPVVGQVAFAGGLTGAAGDAPIAEQRLVTDEKGVASVKISANGRWYVHFVHMTEIRGDPEANYESKWSTLSFGVR